MTTQALGKLLDSYLQDLDGQPGFWRGTRSDVLVCVYSDEEHDRLLLMAPVGIVEELSPELLHELLKANFDRALDARYAMRKNELWTVVAHPLTTLATDDLPNFFDQLTQLVRNTGTTYASTDLVFQPPFPDLVIDEDSEFEDDDEAATDGASEPDEDEEDDEDEGRARGR